MSDASDDSFNDDPIDQDEYDDDMDHAHDAGDGGNDTNTTTTTSSATKSKSQTSHERKSDYQIHDNTSIEHRISEEVTDISSLLDITPQMASMLLRANGWSKDKTRDAYMENGAKMIKDLGLQHIDEDDNATGTEEFNCRICDDDVPMDKTLGHPCKHRFCTDCWRSYMDDSISTGRQCILTHCASYKCPNIIPDRSFQKVVTPENYQKYQHALIRSFVEDNKRMKWCPAPNCIYAAEAFTSTVTTVACKCGHKFCFACNEESHEPASCRDVSAWLDKCRNESETAHWIIANTKKCPKCLVRIEKSQGCNHMTCRSCKYEWCWVCHGSWAEHGNHTGGFYKCNKYDPKSKTKAEKGSAEEAKAELDRYLHYYQRFHNHEQAGKFALRQAAQTEARMTQLQTNSSSAWIDVQFLSAATKQVLECRMVLKYTYVFAYFLPDGPEKTLFEYLQQDLEKNTEHLSELSEMPLDKIDRQATINYTRVTQKFLENLLKGVADGLTS